MDSLPNVVTHGSPLHALRTRESSAIVIIIILGLHVTSPKIKLRSIRLSFYFHEVLLYLNTFT